MSAAAKGRVNVNDARAPKVEAITQKRDVANMRSAASSCNNLAKHRLLLRQTIALSAAEIPRFGVLASNNIAKRMLIHVAGFNLGLLMRKRFGVGTPRGLQGRLAAAIAAFVALIDLIGELLVVPGYPQPAERPAISDSTWLTPELVAA